MKKKRPFTLLEIMIAIFLIGLIGSIIGYNMKGSLDEGRAFKTEQAQIKICDLLELEIARGADIQQVRDKPSEVLKASGVVKNPDNLLKDGWNKPIKIIVSDSGEVSAYSRKLADYNRKKKKLRGLDKEQEADSAEMDETLEYL